MGHQAFEILEDVLPGKRDVDRVAAAKRFKNEIWNLPVWVPGTRTDSADGEVVFSLSLQAQEEGLPLLPTYLHHGEAVGEDGQGSKCLPISFCQLALFAESQRFDAVLVDGEANLVLSHDDILTLRDINRMGADGIPMDEKEFIAMSRAVHRFAAQAYDYCVQWPEVRRLHLALLMATGIKPRLIGMLEASQNTRHADALLELGKVHLQPGWRFHFLDPFDLRDMALLLDPLKAVGPYYSQDNPRGWWARFKSRITTPMVPMIEMNITDRESLDGESPTQSTELNPHRLEFIP